jgi:hypothetical protein
MRSPVLVVSFTSPNFSINLLSSASEEKPGGEIFLLLAAEKRMGRTDGIQEKISYWFRIRW